MRVLILNGSPRPKGNTKQMITAFCEGLEAAGHDSAKDWKPPVMSGMSMMSAK